MKKIHNLVEVSIFGVVLGLLLALSLCCQPIPPVKTLSVEASIQVYIEAGIPLEIAAVANALTWFAEHAQDLLPAVTPALVRQAYDRGLDIRIVRDALPCASTACPTGKADGLYHAGGLIEVVWHDNPPKISSSALMHELIHFLEDRLPDKITCVKKICDNNNPHLQKYCQIHECTYWDYFARTIHYEFWLTENS